MEVKPHSEGLKYLHNRVSLSATCDIAILNSLRPSMFLVNMKRNK
jgi:hypothetical protein